MGNLILWLMFLCSGIMVSEMIQSKDALLQVIGEVLALLFLITSITHYLIFRKIENAARDLKSFKKRGVLLFGNAITLFTVGLSLFVAGTNFGLGLLVVAAFLGYEGYRTKNGHKFFIPVRKK
jgi:Ca2+/Na+ antiporter